MSMSEFRLAKLTYVFERFFGEIFEKYGLLVRNMVILKEATF